MARHVRSPPLLLLLLLLLSLTAPYGGVVGAQSPERACVVSGAERACRDISAACSALNCGTSRVCAVALSGALVCLPASARDFKNCGPERLRLTQPCPADSGIMGFGQGCTFCRGGNPFSPGPAPPGGVQPAPPDLLKVSPQPPSPPLLSRRACVVRHVGNGEFKNECVDIAARCSRKGCPSDTVCGLDLDERIQCFPRSVKDFENCGSEVFRLSQPCPADAGIKGFGMGCNYCVGGNPFSSGPQPPSVPPLVRQAAEGPGTGPRPPSPPTFGAANRACVVRHIRNGEFKKACVDISTRCEERKCPRGTVCGLDLDEQVGCFPESVKEFENCRSESFRLSQPCPADAGIKAFGMGCTFCVGGNPFFPGPVAPSPPSGRPNGRQLTGELNTSGSSPLQAGTACVVVYDRDWQRRERCIDISEQCSQKACPQGSVCGLDLDEQIQCFPASVKEFENCGPESLRLLQPCPADAGVRGFGMGCTFCRGANPFEPAGPPPPEPGLPTPTPLPPTGERSGRACLATPTVTECRDISSECLERGCRAGSVCALGLDGTLRCLPPSATEFQNCGSESLRLSQPCPADAGIRAFGMGCTYCVGGNPFAAPTASQPPPPLGERPLACVSRITGAGEMRRGCLDITELCRRRGCPADRTCALDVDEQPGCFAASQLTVRNCGSARERMARPGGFGNRLPFTVQRSSGRQD
ncbi:uncharacterized protein LOC119107307 [Pollicipes pollicipes]|uniref:uncharacterized protein LOC119107307 n=1 Tax=Pollicipes pollicipes TaxID=41117 RepID=UPI001884C7DF|nr:uncharacterized protein LOC119107307 [Pollicipes pollicipes]